MNRKLLLRKLSSGALHNVSWADFVDLVLAFGFRQQRVQGSHHVFACTGVAEMLNLQRVDGEAKPYQIRQFLKVVESNGLRMQD
jgi:hypothetical protein